MKKSSVKKTVAPIKKDFRKGKVTRVIHESTKEIKIDRALIDNFIALQKVMVNLSGKFDNLTLQISKLLELFEISAKSLARKDFEDMEKENKDMKKVLEKLDNLTSQAGLIGKGLALIHEVGNEKQNVSVLHSKPVFPAQPRTQTQQQVSPRFPASSSMQQRTNIPSSAIGQVRPATKNPEEKV
jgi:hypothetical protein